MVDEPDASDPGSIADARRFLDNHPAFGDGTPAGTVAGLGKGKPTVRLSGEFSAGQLEALAGYMTGGPTSSARPTDDAEYFQAIIIGAAAPDPRLVKAGWDAHQAGKLFHEGPKPTHSVEALCWRIGWNDRALATG